MCPLILSAIYQYNKKWIYYFSSFTALIAAIIMGYMSTWGNVKEIGRTSMFKAEDAKEEKVEIEMKAQGTSSVPPTEKNQTEVLSAPEGEVKPVRRLWWRVRSLLRLWWRVRRNLFQLWWRIRHNL